MKDHSWMGRYNGPIGGGIAIYRAPIVGMAGALPFELGICSFDVQNLDALRSIDELNAYDASVKARIAEIDHEYAGLPLPDAQRDEWAALTESHTQTEARVTELRAREAQVQALADAPDHQEPAGLPAARRTVAARRTTPDNIYDLAAYRNITRSDAEHLAALQDGAMRAAEGASFSERVDAAKAKAHLEHLLRAEDQNIDREALARRVLASGSPQYIAAFGKYVARGGMAGLSTQELQALSLGTDSAGGFMVPFALDPTIILTSDGVINPLRSVARVEQITGKKWQGVASAGITVTRKAENEQADDNSPTLTQPEAETTRVEAFVPFSRELDASINVAAQIAPLLADAKDTEEADSFINGDGQGNSPEGLIGTLAGGSFIATVGAGGFGPEDVYALKNGVPPRWRGRGRFLGETGIYDLVRQFDEAGGANLWVQLQDATPPRLAGYPALEISTMDAALTAGAHILAFGDFKQFLIVDRIGMSVDVIPHLFGANHRPTGQRGLFAIWANGTTILADNAFRVLEVGS